jgi:hypothetical protein
MVVPDIAPPPRPGRYFNLLALPLVGMCIAIIVVVIHWSLDMTPPFTATTVSVAGYDWTDGNVLWIERAGKRNRYCPGSSHRWIEARTLGGDFRIEVQNTGIPFASGEPGEEERWYYPIFLPSHIEGRMRFRVVMHYMCNPIQTLLRPMEIEMPPMDFDLPLKPERHFPPEFGHVAAPGIVTQNPYPQGSERNPAP